MQIPTRSRGPAPAQGPGAATSAQPSGRADRLATLRASQAALSAENRQRRLLLALVIPELVVVLVLLLAGSYIGVVVAVVAVAVQVAAALLLVPVDDAAVIAAAPRPAPSTIEPALLAGQGQEIAALRARLETADAGLALQNELARRQRELLLRQLSRIDALEADEADPAALGELFTLDHLATRMRRYSEGALLIAGSGTGGAGGAPVLASEVLRGAVAEIEDFHRVDVSVDRDVLLDGAAAVDLVHLLAELIENAAVFSPTATRVKVHGQAGQAGYAVTIADDGVGIASERAAELRALLGAEAPRLTPGRLGYQLVARLARRQGLAIDVVEVLDGSAAAGATVVVSLPPALVVGDDAPAAQELPAPPSGSPGTAAIVPPPPDAPPYAAAAAASTVPALTIPEAGEGLPADPPHPVLPLPEPAATSGFAAVTYEAPPFDAPRLDPPAFDPPAFDPPAFDPPAFDAQSLDARSFDAPTVADLAQAASIAEAGFVGVPHAPAADWAGPPSPLDHLDEPFVLPYDLGDVLGEELGVLPDGLLPYAAEPAPAADNVVTPDFAAHAAAVSAVPAGPDTSVLSAPTTELPAEPEPIEPEPVAPAVLVPAHLPTDLEPLTRTDLEPLTRTDLEPLTRTGLEPLTRTGLVRRTPQAHMAPQMADDTFEPLPEDLAAVPAPDRSRSLLSAYRDGLVLGRGGLTPDDVRHHIDDRQQLDTPFDETGDLR